MNQNQPLCAGLYDAVSSVRAAQQLYWITMACLTWSVRSAAIRKALERVVPDKIYLRPVGCIHYWFKG